MAEAKRRWWQGVLTIGGALGLGALLPWLARLRRGPEELGLTVGMPTRPGEPNIPVAAVYDEDWGRVPVVTTPQVLIAIDSDGRVIWSQDSLKGGPSYRIGKVSPQRVQALLDELDHDGIFNDPTRNESHRPIHCKFTTIAIASGARRLHIESTHELEEARTGGVATPCGSIEPLDGRDRAQVLAAQPEGHRHFRQIWDRLREALTNLIPAESHDLGTAEFRLKRISPEEQP